jgi:hypothetical protein
VAPVAPPEKLSTTRALPVISRSSRTPLNVFPLRELPGFKVSVSRLST